MSRVLSIRALLCATFALAALIFASPAWSQHGHAGGHGHGGFGGHSYGGHHSGSHGIGGHGYGGHYGGGHGYGVHGGLHGYSHYGYGHYGYGHDYGHGYAAHDYGGRRHGLRDYGHGRYLHRYGHHDYYPHSLYHHYPYYDSYPYYGWYPSYSVSLYPWYGFYGAPDYQGDAIVSRRPVLTDEHAGHDHSSVTTDDRTEPPGSTVSAQGLTYQRRAESAFRGGRFDEALRLANHALVEMPRNGNLLLFVSQSLFATGDYRGAAAAIHQASTMLDKADWGYVVKNWRDYYRGSAYREAMDKLNTYVKENPDVAYARFLRAYHFGFLGQEEFARKEMTKAIELEGRDQLAIELLTRFGGEPPIDASDPADVDRTSGANPTQDQRKVESEHDHDDHEHGHDDHRGHE